MADDRIGNLTHEEAVEAALDAIGDARHAIHQGHSDIALACLDRARIALEVLPHGK